jgi:multidrug efflux pump subunit AcrA (membrane-fusion protein)
VAALTTLNAQSIADAATAAAQQASDSAEIASLQSQYAELQDAFAHSTSELERANTQSQQALQQLQQEHSTEVTRLQSELTTLQQQLELQVSYYCQTDTVFVYNHYISAAAYICTEVCVGERICQSGKLIAYGLHAEAVTHHQHAVKAATKALTYLH